MQHTNTNEFLLADPLLEEVRLYVLEAGKFNIGDVQSKYRVGFRRAIFLRDALIAEGILGATEADGQNWLAGSSVIQEMADELDVVVQKVVSIVGPGGSREFQKLVKVMAVDRASVMRMVIIAGIRSLLGVLGDK